MVTYESMYHRKRKANEIQEEEAAHVFDENDTCECLHIWLYDNIGSTGQGSSGNYIQYKCLKCKKTRFSDVRKYLRQIQVEI